MIDTVILAAGSGRRWGGPKALAVHENRTFLDRVLETTRVVSDRIVVVLPPELDVSAVPGINDIMSVRNPSPEDGMMSSVQLGLGALDPVRDTLIFPVDHPLVRPETLLALAAGRSAGPDSLPESGSSTPWVVIPALGSKTGHPILISAAVAAALVQEPTHSTLRAALGRVASRGRHLSVEDPGVLRNINQKKDLDSS